MRKKWMVWMLSLVLMMGLALPVSADIIWEPQDNFYESHHEECEYEGRRYQMAGYADEVTVYSKPDGAAQKTVSNGQSGIVQFIWQGEDQAWGYVYNVGEEQAEGWAPMDDLALIYDSQAFMEDHAHEIGSCEPIEAEISQLAFYSYPGGPWQGTLNQENGQKVFSQLFDQTYTDDDGRLWGHLGYFQGLRDVWACLDDPMNEHLDTRVVEPGPSVAQLRQSPSVADSGTDPMLLAGGLVAAVVAVTAALLKKLHPKK